MRKPESSLATIRENEKPSTLISLQLTNRLVSDLSGIEKYKSLSELDVSGNCLSFPVPQLFSLKYLKKLSLSNNQIKNIWDLPLSLEHLNLSNNFITSIETIVPLLVKLQSLDISHNQIESLKPLSKLINLKSISASWNKITSLSGIDDLKDLLEVEVEGNLIRKCEDLSVLNVNLTVSVINLLGNPVLEDIRASKTCFGFTELKEGIFYRNPERLNELKTSQYKSLIKKHKKTDNAERGFSKRSSKQGSSCASFREVYDQIICEDPSEENPVRDSLFTLGSGDENENYIEVNKIPISKLQLDKISDKPSYEKWSTKPDSSLEALFEDLISYCGLEEPQDPEFSFSNEKYEAAITILKHREDERKSLIQQLENMKAKISEFEILNTKITSELSQCQTEIINTKHHSEKIQKKCEKLMKEKDDLNHEMFESQNSMLKKIREMEAEHELSKRTLNMSMEDYHFDSSKILMSNRADSSFSVTKEMSYFQYNNHDKSEALVNKEVGEYVQKLLMKIANFADKVKKLRNQRDKLKQFYDKYKHVIYPVK